MDGSGASGRNSRRRETFQVSTSSCLQLLKIITNNRLRFFTKMPDEHYMIISKLILCNAADDVPSAEEIRTKIKDIFDIRDAKLRTSIKTFLQGSGTYAKLDNLTQFEIHTVRPLLPHALDHIARYQRAAIAAERKTNTMSNSGFAGTSGHNSFFTQ